jgi:hypothetical protein
VLARNSAMLKSQYTYIATSILSSLGLALGIAFWFVNLLLSFVLSPIGTQYQVLMVLAFLFGAIIYLLVFRLTPSRSDYFTKPHILLYLFSILVLWLCFFLNSFLSPGSWALWIREPLQDIQLNQGYVYQAKLGHPEYHYQQMENSKVASILENGTLLTGESAACFSEDINIIRRGNCFFGDIVIFSTSDNSDPRVNGRLYELLYPARNAPTYIYIFAFLSLLFVTIHIFLLADREKIKTFLLILFVIGFPFVYLFPYVFSLNNSYIRIGNDYVLLYYNYKVYLLDFLSHLRIPLWSPSEAAGFPFYSSPFTQTFYPLNILLAIYYRIAGGYTEFDNNRFTIFGISLFALGLFLWLRQLNLNLRAVLFGAVIMAVSFKVTEILRFPNAIHTAAWYPWVLYSITKIFQSKSSRQAWRYGIIFFFSLICLLTGGYPYYVFYSIFLFIPYVLLFFIPEIRKTVFDIQCIEWKRTLAVFSTFGLAALAVCSPYIVAMASLMRQTTDRAGSSYEYSTAQQFNITDTIGSLFFPPAAQLEGIYYFGAVGVLLILFYIFSGKKGVYSSANVLDLNDSDKESTSNRADLWLKVIFLVWIGVISYITYGRESYLFGFLWHHMPLFSSLRVWGRMNIILVPIFAWFLALAYQYFESIVFAQEPSFPNNWRFGRVKPALYLILNFSIVLVFQLLCLDNKVIDEYWTAFIAPTNIYESWSKYFAGQEWLASFFKMMSDRYASLSPDEIVTDIGILFLVFTILAFLMLIFFVLRPPQKFDLKQRWWSVWIILFVFSVINMISVGPWMWTNGVAQIEPPFPLNITNKNSQSLTTTRTHEFGIRFSNTFGVGIMPNWYFDRYITFLKTQATDSFAMDQLLGITDGKRLYFSERIDYPSVREFLADAGRFQALEKVVSYTGDKLVIKVQAPRKGFISFIDNWEEGWSTTIDGKSVSIDLLFGTFKSVQLTPGNHIVIFEYRPGFFR